LEAPLNDGLVLVTGASGPGLGLLFAEFPDATAAVPLQGAFGSAAEVDAALAEVQRLYPGRPIVGLAHFGGCGPSAAAAAGTGGLADEPAALDERLRSLTLLCSRLVPAMRASGLPCRVLTVSTERALASPSSWAPREAMRSLSSGFVEQYTEALAEELVGSNVTVFGVRVSEDVLAAAAASAGGTGAVAERLWDALSLPAAEVHGRVVALGDCGLGEGGGSSSSSGGPKKGPSGGPRGGIVLGASIDTRWALRAAAGRAAEYPADARPKAYAELAAALGVPEDSLVWCHGASDVIIRVTAVAAARGARRGAARCWALQQGPTWPNAEGLLRSGGASSVVSIEYPEPWLSAVGEAGDHSEAAAAHFWERLEREVCSPATADPPSVVYLVHPHFPTGHKDPRFAERLQALVGKADGRTLFAVDQTYLNFTPRTEDDALLQRLASESESVALVRSLSKVEGLAALRLGYALANPAIARELAGGLPFSGGLYISEVALAGAVAALCGRGAGRHREAVLSFYATEQRRFSADLVALGVRFVVPSLCPYFCIRASRGALDRAVRAGAAIQCFGCVPALGQGVREDSECWAVCLVADKAANDETVEALRVALEEESQKSQFPSWMPNPMELVRPFVGS